MSEEEKKDKFKAILAQHFAKRVKKIKNIQEISEHCNLVLPKEMEEEPVFIEEIKYPKYH